MNAPECLVLELPSSKDECPIKCLHCIHKNVEASTYETLSHEEIVTLLTSGRAMGIEYLNIYPHNDEISLEPMEALPYIKLGYALGYKVKTVSNGANPKGVAKLLPYLHRIALSVDSIQIQNYANLRLSKYHPSLLQSIETVKTYKQTHPLRATALIVANKNSIAHIHDDVQQIHELDTFDRIKILEMLPIGTAKALQHESLDTQEYFVDFLDIKEQYRSRVDIGTPLWRIRKEERRGCLLGEKDLVIGPNGQLAGCSLLFYLNSLVGNVREFGSLQEAWAKGFHAFRDKSKRPVDPLCLKCAFYQHDLCWGGCLARVMIFGAKEEMRRSCGIRSAEASQELYRTYLKSDHKSTFFTTLPSLNKEKKRNN